MNRGRRVLTERELRWAALPQLFWSVSINNITSPQYRKLIGWLVETLELFPNQWLVWYLYSPDMVSLKEALSVACREFLRRSHSVFWLDEQYLDKLDEPIDNETTFIDRAAAVEYLFVFKDALSDSKQLLQLLQNRCYNNKVSILIGDALVAREVLAVDLSIPVEKILALTIK